MPCLAGLLHHENVVTQEHGHSGGPKMEGPTMPKSVHSPQSLTDCILTQPQPLRQPLVDFLDLVLSSLSSHAVLQAPDSFLPFLLASFQKSMVKGGKSFFCLGVAWRLPWGGLARRFVCYRWFRKGKAKPHRRQKRK